MTQTLPEPMLAAPVSDPALQPGWAGEPKWDGWRALVSLDVGRARWCGRLRGASRTRLPLDAVSRTGCAVSPGNSLVGAAASQRQRAVLGRGVQPLRTHSLEMTSEASSGTWARRSSAHYRVSAWPLTYSSPSRPPTANNTPPRWAGMTIAPTGFLYENDSA